MRHRGQAETVAERVGANAPFPFMEVEVVMAVAVVYRPPALDAEPYKASWADGSPMPDPEGLLFHAGVGEGDDFFTVSVWETREAYDAFASRFKEALGAEGLREERPRYSRCITR